MAKSDPAASKKERNKTIRWVVTIFFITIVISGTISLVSDEIMSRSGIGLAFVILFAIVLLGIAFDIVGVAVTAADEKPFHSMASRKVSGAREALKLLRNSDRVSSICCDVVGDICGVVSGAASATIAALILNSMTIGWPQIVTLFMSALVAGMTVGGKAIGKGIAIGSATKIVQTVGKIIYVLRYGPDWFRKRKNKR